MIRHLSLFLLLFGFIMKITTAQIPYNSRYFEAIFDEINIETDVIYGNAPAINFPYFDEGNTSAQDLLMDIFQPVGDTLDFRPVLICAHSGAFVSGSKDVDDMQAFCDSMAHRGYVTASIDYRLGMNALSSSSSTRAVYRGIQDGRAAIRFFKENMGLYGIDTNNIYLLGSSAGGYIAQHNMFMDMEDERPDATYNSPNLGCLDCSGNSFQHSGKANGIIALWGALEDTNLIISTDTLPVFLAHGTADETVPFGYGFAFGNELFPPSYGSSLVAAQLESFGNNPETYFVWGEGHEFYGTNNGNWPDEPNQYWDSIFNKTVDFTLNIHKPKAGFWMQQFENIVMFYDSSSNATNWYWDFGDGYYSTEQNPSHEYQTPGEFYPIQFASNDLISWDTTSAYVLSWVGIEEIKKPDFEVFPNPAKDFISIKNLSNQLQTINVINLSGQILMSLQLDVQQSKTVDISGLEPGVYVIADKWNGTIRKLIRQ